MDNTYNILYNFAPLHRSRSTHTPNEERHGHGHLGRGPPVPPSTRHLDSQAPRGRRAQLWLVPQYATDAAPIFSTHAEHHGHLGSAGSSFDAPRHLDSDPDGPVAVAVGLPYAPPPLPTTDDMRELAEILRSL
jgi:hypothetical protein